MLDTYVGRLSDKLQEMIDRVPIQIGETATNLAEASRQLATTVEETRKAIQGIATVSQEVAQGFEEELKMSEEITSGMGQLSRAIDQVAQGSQEQAGCGGTGLEHCARDFRGLRRSFQERPGSGHRI